MTLFETINKLNKDGFIIVFLDQIHNEVCIEMKKWVGEEVYKVRMRLYDHEHCDAGVINVLGKMKEDLNNHVSAHSKI